MNETNRAFKAQRRVRGPWRRYLDDLAPLRPDLHRYCCRLTAPVEAFMQALAAKDLVALEQLCAADLSIEMVGGWESDSFEQSRSFFTHAHVEMPALGFGRKPRWELLEFDGEWMVLGLRTLNGQEAVNEIHRIVENEGRVTRVRSYCFCPETLGVVAGRLGRSVVQRPISHRSPSMADVPRLLLRHLTTRRP